MNSKALKLALLLVLASPAAHAFSSQSPDDVPSSLKILGRGIWNHHAQTSLATVCVGDSGVEGSEPTCDRLRVVEFDANRIPHWVGPSFEISNQGTFRVQLKKQYRKKYRIHFLKMRKKPRRTYSVAGAIGLGSVLGMAAFSHTINAVIIPAMVVGTGWTLIAIPAAAVLLLSIAYAHDVDVIAAPVNLVLAPFRGLGNVMVVDRTSSMTATNSWNWAQQPDEVSARKYEKIKALLADFADGTVTPQ